MGLLRDFILNVVGFIYAISIVALMIFLLFFIPTNIGGLLFGFENNSPICNDYITRTSTVGEMIMSPITPYACSKNGGLLTVPKNFVLKQINKPWFDKR